MYENTEMRKIYATEMLKLMAENKKIVTLDADLAKVFGNDALIKAYPEYSFNCGIAEANMACMAAGLSAYGYIPFISTFTVFAARRIADQVAISISYAKQNVKIAAFDAGITAEYNGGTHMSMEDIGIMNAIPGILIFEPIDAVSLVKGLPQVIAHNGPVYLRMLRKAKPAQIFADDFDFDLYKANVIRTGKDVTIVATSIEVAYALEAAKLLEAKGISAEVVAVCTVKPLDEATVLASVKKTGCCVVAENSNVCGGLGSIVAEALAKTTPAPMEFIGVQDHFGEVGNLQFLTEKYHMADTDIAAAAEKVIKRK
jgi:transketolase